MLYMKSLDTFSSIEQIKNSFEYWLISIATMPFQTQLMDVLDSEKWNNPSTYFANISLEELDNKLGNINFESIRRLKQSLNNYFCTQIYQQFILQLWEINSSELTILSDKDKLTSLSTDDFFYSWMHPFRTRYMIELINILAKFKIPTSRVIPYNYKIHIISYYFWIWEKIIHNTFLIFLQNIIYKSNENRQIFWQYLILESYVMRNTPIKKGENFCSIIDSIFLNHSTTYLKKYISEELKWEIDIDRIKSFLLNQARYNIKMSSSPENSDILNFFEISLWKSLWLVFSSEVWCYIINKDHVQDNSTHLTKRANIKKIQWCPFAKTKLINWENAFLSMFHVLDSFLIQILLGLKKKGF